MVKRHIHLPTLYSVYTRNRKVHKRKNEIPNQGDRSADVSEFEA